MDLVSPIVYCKWISTTQLDRAVINSRAGCIIAVAHLRARFACDCTILRTSQQFASSLISSPSEEPKGRTE